MTGREKRFLIVGAAVVAVAAAGAVYASIQDGRQLRFESPANPIAYIQAERERKRREACRAELRRIGLALHQYAEEPASGPVLDEAELKKNRELLETFKSLYPQYSGGPSPAAPQKQEP